jgi:hypothetical protein
MKIVNGYSQLDYNELKNFVSTTPLSEFTAQAPHPFLVGKDLYDGELKSKIGGALRGTSTMKFSAADFRREASSPPITFGETTVDYPNSKHSQEKERQKILQSFYMLRKKGAISHESSNSDVITIGRNGTNDIVIADKVVSNKHAQIHIRNGMYYIEDLHSTNGVKVDSLKVWSGKMVKLLLNSEISFGRLVFVFTPPLLVYRAMRKEIAESEL